MKSMEQYYTRDSLADTVRALSDPQLSHERNREDVNELVINLVIKYVAEYLEVHPDDIFKIRSRVHEALKKGPEYVMALVTQMTDSLFGMRGGSRLRDMLAIESAADIRSTAAIAKEIIFNDRFKKGDQFISVDLGHGTGILTLAAAIAGKRSECRRVLTVGLDLQESAVRQSERVLGNVLQKDQFKVGRADIANPNLWEVFNGLPLHSWISETVSFSTPKIEMEDEKWRLPPERSRDGIAIAMNIDLDPFPLVFGGTLDMRPNFKEDVRNGKTAMFPDIINGFFTPDGWNSTLALRTGICQDHAPLNEVGKEFAEFQDFELKGGRWQAPEDSATLKALRDAETSSPKQHAGKHDGGKKKAKRKAEKKARAQNRKRR